MFSGPRSSYETPRGLDHEEVGAGHSARDVPAGPDDESVADQLGVERGDLGAYPRDRDLGLDVADVPVALLGILALDHGTVSSSNRRVDDVTVV